MSNSKIPLRIFAEVVSQKIQLPVDECQSLIKSLFEIINENLLAGEKVVVEKLGEFEVRNFPQNPILFTPSPSLAAELNAPFNMFEAITLPDNFNEEEINEINNDVLVESEDVDRDGESKDVDAIEQSEEIIEESGELSEEVTGDTETVADEIVSEQLNVTVNEAEDLSTSDEVESADCEDYDVQEVISTEIPVEDIEEILPPELPVQQIPETIIPQDEEEFVEYHYTKVTKFWPGFTVGFISGIVLSLVGYAAYLFIYG